MFLLKLDKMLSIRKTNIISLKKQPSFLFCFEAKTFLQAKFPMLIHFYVRFSQELYLESKTRLLGLVTKLASSELLSKIRFYLNGHSSLL